MSCFEYEENHILAAKDIYLKYVGIKQYFYGNYDYFAYNKKIGSKALSGFEKKRDLHACVSLYKQYKNLDVIEKVLVLNVKNDKNWWVGMKRNDSNFLEKGKRSEKYLNFISFLDSSEYIFSQQIKPIFSDPNYSYEKYFIHSEEFKHTRIFSMFEDKLIKEEVLIILDFIFDGFLEKNYIEYNDFIFEPVYLNVMKYKKFLEKWGVFDILKYENIIKKFISLNNNQ